MLQGKYQPRLPSAVVGMPVLGAGVMMPLQFWLTFWKRNEPSLPPALKLE